MLRASRHRASRAASLRSGASARQTLSTSAHSAPACVYASVFGTSASIPRMERPGRSSKMCGALLRQ